MQNFSPQNPQHFSQQTIKVLKRAVGLGPSYLRVVWTDRAHILIQHWCILGVITKKISARLVQTTSKNESICQKNTIHQIEEADPFHPVRAPTCGATN